MMKNEPTSSAEPGLGQGGHKRLNSNMILQEQSNSVSILSLSASEEDSSHGQSSNELQLPAAVKQQDSDEQVAEEEEEDDDYLDDSFEDAGAADTVISQPPSDALQGNMQLAEAPTAIQDRVCEEQDEEQLMEIESDAQDGDEETKFDQIMGMDPAELQRRTSSIQQFAAAVSQESIHSLSSNDRNQFAVHQPNLLENQPRQATLQMRTFVRKSANDALRARKDAQNTKINHTAAFDLAGLTKSREAREQEQHDRDSADRGDMVMEEATIEEEFATQEIAYLAPALTKQEKHSEQSLEPRNNAAGSGLSHQASLDFIGEHIMAVSQETDTIQSQSTIRRKNRQDPDQLKVTCNSLAAKQVSSKGKAIKVRNHMQERNRSKESVSILVQPPHAAGNRNHQRLCQNLASHKSLKFVDADARSNHRDSQSAASLSHQDQYSSHKVLASGKHIAINLDQHQQHAVAAIAAGKARPLSKQNYKMKVQTSHPLKAAAMTECSQTSNLLMHNKSGAGLHQQTSSGSNKRGTAQHANQASNFANSNAAGAPFTQKQTKSKARMIRNILQSSNLNSDKTPQAPPPPQQQPPAPFSVVVPQWPALEADWPTSSFVLEDEARVEQAFQDLFSELMQDATQGGNTVTVVKDLPPSGNQVEQETRKVLEIELNLRRAQAKQKYRAERENLKCTLQQFQSQSKYKIAALRAQQASFDQMLQSMLRKAQYEIDYQGSREYRRIWRNVNKLSLSWLSSVLVEAEKSRQFALHKTQSSLEQIVFTAHEFQPPGKVSQRKQSTKESSGSVLSAARHFTRDQYGEFQAHEVYKFLSQLPSRLQFLIDFHQKPFTVTKSATISAADITINSDQVAASSASTKRQNIVQAVIDFAKQHAYAPGGTETDALPIAFISQVGFADERGEHTYLECAASQSQLPSPMQALYDCSDLIERQIGGYLPALKSKAILRASDSLVSNKALDVMNAGSTTLSGNRYVYVCLKEAHALAIELPRHAQMQARVQQNKTIGRLHENAMPVNLALRKMQKQFALRERKLRASCKVIKPIKGLSQVKVEFQEQPNKIFSVLAEVDLSILKQTREYAQFFMPAPSQSAALISSGAPQGVSLYVIESEASNSGKFVRQLQGFEVLFLLQLHLRLSKPIKLMDFTLNQAQFASQRHSAAEQPGLRTTAQQDSSLKARVKAVAESRNSITIGSVHQDDALQAGADEASNRDLIIDTTRQKPNDYNSADVNALDDSVQTQYLIINERFHSNRRLKCRYIVKVAVRRQQTPSRQTNKSTFSEAVSSTDKEDIHQAPQLKLDELKNKKESQLCIWPNCLQTTDSLSTLMTLQKLQQTMIAGQKDAANCSNLQQQLQLQQSAANIQSSNTAAGGGGPGGGLASRKTRPDSAYRSKQNQSQQTTNQPLNHDKIVQKRINKLRIALELELAESLYCRFIKKGKAIKGEKIGAAGHQVNSSTKTRSSWNHNYNSNSQANNRQQFLADASTLAPVLSTIVNPTGSTLSSSLITAAGLSPFFTRLCPQHQQLERFLAHSFNISLHPSGPLNPNAFLKGLRSYETWRSETKTALMNDLFTMKQANAAVDGGSTQQGAGVSILNDTLTRIFNFSLTQVAQVGGPDILSLIQSLQQIPRSINYPDKFFTWIESFTRHMSPLMVKNGQFKDAVTHFQFQLAPLSANLKQVKLNEDFIGVELKKWLNFFIHQQQQSTPSLRQSKRPENAGSSHLNQNLTSQQMSYLVSNFNSLQKILTVSDVIHRFTFFQQFINKMNSFGATNLDRSITPQKSGQMPQSAMNQHSVQQSQLGKPVNTTLSKNNIVTKHAGYRGVLINTNQQAVIQASKKNMNTKANLLPYAATPSQENIEQASVSDPQLQQHSLLNSCTTMAMKATSQDSHGHEALPQHHTMTNSSTLYKITAIYGGVTNPYSSAASAYSSNLPSHHHVMRKTNSQHNTTGGHSTTSHGVPTPKNQHVLMMSSDGFLSQKKHSQQINQEVPPAAAQNSVLTTTNLFQQSKQSSSKASNTFSSSMINQRQPSAAVASSSSVMTGLFEYYHQPTAYASQYHYTAPASATNATTSQLAKVASHGVGRIDSHQPLIQIQQATGTGYQRIKARSNRGALQSNSAVAVINHQQSSKSGTAASNLRITGGSGAVLHSSAEPVMVSRSSRKKRILSKGGGAGSKQAVSSHQQTQQLNFQPAQSVALQNSRDWGNEQTNLPSYHSVDFRKQQSNVGHQPDLASMPLTTQLTDISERQPLAQASQKFMTKQGYSTQTGSFLKSSTTTNAHVKEQQHQQHQQQPSQLIQPTSATAAAKDNMIRITQQKQRAASAKKELIATYSSGLNRAWNKN